jgi:hypothetical protein
MEIVRTMPGDKRFYLFEELPKQLYPAQCLHSKTEAFSFSSMHDCYVLMNDGAPKARAVLYQNPGLFYQGKKALAVGNYESVENENISGKFLNHIIEEAKKLNADFLIGPMDGSTWNNYRFSLHNNHDNFLLEAHHPVYYNQQFLSAGFKLIARYTSKINRNLFCDHKEVLMKENKLLNTGVTIRNIDVKNFEKELCNLYPFICNAFQNNFLFTPIASEIFIEKYKKLSPFIRPEFVLIAEDAQRNIVGFIFCYDDLLNKKEKSLIIKTLARDPRKQWSGLGSVLANRIISLAKQQGYQSIVHAFIIDDGNSSEASRKFFGNTYKEYALYGLELKNSNGEEF